jgi:transcriptional regulator with XRE-family HTH domain
MKRVKPKPFPTEALVRSPADLGAAIRASRTRVGLKLEDAAETLGITAKTLAAIETGKPGVRLANLLHAAHGLGVDLYVAPRNRRDVITRRLASLTAPE